MPLALVARTVQWLLTLRSVTDSLLRVAARHVSAATQRRPVAVQEVPVTRLAELDPGRLPRRSTSLGDNVQGHEAGVVPSTTGVLSHTRLLEAKLGLVSLHEGQQLAG